MSRINNTQSIEILEEKKFWKNQRIMNIFNLFVQGKTIPDIAEMLTMKPVTVEVWITHKFFIKKLEAHIRGILFTNQVAKVIAASDVFSKLWERVTDNINEIPPEICLKELTKLFPTKKEGMIINPKNMNVFMKVMKGEDPGDLDERLADMDDDMGFEGLDENPDANYPELGEGHKDDGIKQGDHTVDPEKPSKDK